MLELENKCMKEVNERKHLKYEELVEKCQEGGWKTPYELIAVRCRGFLVFNQQKGKYYDFLLHYFNFLRL